MPNLMNTRLCRSNRLGLGGCRDRVHRHVQSPLFARQGRRLPAEHSAVSCSFVERWTWLRILAVCQPHGLAPATTVRDHRTDAANISFAGAQLEEGSKAHTSLCEKNKRPRKGAFNFSGGEGGMDAARPHLRLRRCLSRRGFEVLNPLGKNAKRPIRGVSYFGGEGGIRTHGTGLPYT